MARKKREPTRTERIAAYYREELAKLMAGEYGQALRDLKGYTGDVERAADAGDIAAIQRLGTHKRHGKDGWTWMTGDETGVPKLLTLMRSAYSACVDRVDREIEEARRAADAEAERLRVEAEREEHDRADYERWKELDRRFGSGAA